MDKNISHYNLDKLEPGLLARVNENKLDGPCFVGQGLSRQVGSDCYGFYIVSRKDVDGKTVCGESLELKLSAMKAGLKAP